MPSIGDVIETRKSHESGIVLEVVDNENGTCRCFIDTPSGQRWTTF
jgi:hypothetical protein